jgi:hypothetical protein
VPTNAQVADALRALADIIESRTWDRQAHHMAAIAASGHPMSVVTFKSDGRAERILAGMADVTEPEPYEGEITKYLIRRGNLLGLPIEVMESQDD